METTDRSVFGIISVFRESLQEFKNYKERKRKLQKDSNHGRYKVLKGKDESSSGNELKLSNSLRQGALDVQREYDRHFRTLGDRYAVGDETAHLSLGRTLRKLNTCLHNIISSLLSCGRKELKVDYQYLTSVSDISRQETVEALSQLSCRMSQSAFSLHQQKQEEKHKRRKGNDAKAGRKIPSSKSVSDVTERSRQSGMSGHRKEQVVRKVHLRSASTPQLAMVRPRARRSSSSKSEVFSSPNTTPVPSSVSTAVISAGRRRRNKLEQHNQPPLPTMAQPIIHAPSPPLVRRRQDKITPSMHTFASASTRLGEIPEIKWSIPYDYDVMSRLNGEHGGRPWPPPAEPAKPKRGLFSLFKKSEMKTAEVAT